MVYNLRLQIFKVLAKVPGIASGIIRIKKKKKCCKQNFEELYYIDLKMGVCNMKHVIAIFCHFH